jgi:hypothetical protein
VSNLDEVFALAVLSLWGGKRKQEKKEGPDSDMAAAAKAIREAEIMEGHSSRAINLLGQAQEAARAGDRELARKYAQEARTIADKQLEDSLSGMLEQVDSRIKIAERSGLNISQFRSEEQKVKSYRANGKIVKAHDLCVDLLMEVEISLKRSM